MNVARLKKQLMREAKTNPKKAGMLVVLTAIGIYKFIPLLGLFQDKDVDDMTAAGTPSAAMGGAPTTVLGNSAGGISELPAGAGRQAAVVEPPWNVLVAELDKDSRTTPDEDVLKLADPFRGAAPEGTGEEFSQFAAAETTPENLGISLNSTAVGTNRRTALINGKVYAEGNEVPTEKGWNFVLSEIHPGRIVLELDGKKIEVSLPKPVVTGVSVSQVSRDEQEEQEDN